jgi:hypothetical protein
MLETDIFSLLSTDAGIQALGASGNVYDGFIPKGMPVSPSIAIQLVPGTQRIKAADGTNALIAKKLRINSRHAQSGKALILANAVQKLLQDLSGNLATTSVQGVISGDEVDMGIEPSDSGYVFRRYNDFQFWYVDGAGSVPYTPIAPTIVGANAGYIEGVPISAAAPTDGQGLVYDVASGMWKPGTVSGGGGGNFAGAEVPSGAIDGVNAVFTLLHTPIGGSLQLFKNLGITIEGIAYTRAANVVTFNASYIPQSGDSVVAFYRY